MIYKGHDLRIEKGHIRCTDMYSGYSWTEDTLKDAKHEIDTIAAIRIALNEKEGGDENEKSV